ncbi:bifunctional folylpolyglutamate synthase/dihydrofolate synthase [Ligilactobacillus sp.]|uniref:bifunctional folylpolyglutamate synthase/dihydrofolate synthase n=1 Tax=Ligilactobacillus sp. TaxID=2767921 RepID=UPI002FE25475
MITRRQSLTLKTGKDDDVHEQEVQSMSKMSYDEAVSFIHGRRKFTKDPSLVKMRRMTELMGNPEKKLKLIHVTGTNGKGSVTAYLRELLMSHGYRVGTFTSPFIVRFNERIAIDGKMIPDNELVEEVERIKPVIERIDDEFENDGPKEFEVLTAIMLDYFARMEVDYAVVEVGIGGTYDSTNIIDPLVSVITTVAMDHAKILGDTIAKVAENKAGIIKRKRPVVIGRLPKEALEVVLSRAKAQNSRVYQPEIDYRARFEESPDHFWGESFTYEFEKEKWPLQGTGLFGNFQVDNAACALTAFNVLSEIEEIKINRQKAGEALENTRWPGRFERIQENPLIVLDGAHNPSAMEEIEKTLETNFKGRKITVVLGILADKSSDEMLEVLLKNPKASIILTGFDGPRQVASPKKLHERHPRTIEIDDWQEALETALMQDSDLILVSGSLYFIADVRKHILERGGLK